MEIIGLGDDYNLPDVDCIRLVQYLRGKVTTMVTVILLDFSTRAGKQFMWIVCSFGLGFILLMLEDTLYDMFSYIIYIGLILLLVVTIFIAPDTKGSRSWLILGSCQSTTG